MRAWIWQPEHEVAWVAEKGAGIWRNGERVVREPVADGVPPRGVTSIWPLRGHSLGSLPALRRVVGVLRRRLPPADGGRGRLHPLRAQQPLGPRARHADGHRGRWLRSATPTERHTHQRSLTPGIIVAADRARMPPCAASPPTPSPRAAEARSNRQDGAD